MILNELRINNLLLIKDGRNDGDILKVHGVNALNSGHVYDEDDCIFGLDMVEPIPLSEEWLLRLGFEATDNRSERHLFKDFFHWYSSVNDIALEFDNGLNGYDYHCNISYVHQLQNLFHSLTGQELESSVPYNPTMK